MGCSGEGSVGERGAGSFPRQEGGAWTCRCTGARCAADRAVQLVCACAGSAVGRGEWPRLSAVAHGFFGGVRGSFFCGGSDVLTWPLVGFAFLVVGLAICQRVVPREV